MLRPLHEIDEFIRRKVEAGSRPADIAGALNSGPKGTAGWISTEWVRARMDALGFPNEEGSHLNLYRVHPMWDAPADQLREAIWKRQHEGAVAALQVRRN